MAVRMVEPDTRRISRSPCNSAMAMPRRCDKRWFAEQKAVTKVWYGMTANASVPSPSADNV